MSSADPIVLGLQRQLSEAQAEIERLRGQVRVLEKENKLMESILPPDDLKKLRSQMSSDADYVDEVTSRRRNREQQRLENALGELNAAAQAKDRFRLEIAVSNYARLPGHDDKLVREFTRLCEEVKRDEYMQRERAIQDRLRQERDRTVRQLDDARSVGLFPPPRRASASGSI